MITAGIDIGSTTTKAVILGPGKTLLGHAVKPTGGNNRQAAEQVLQEALGKAGVDRKDLAQVFTTGYGRENIPFANRQITEITCHAIGVHSVFPDVRMIVDIGGQDTKGIQIDAEGKVVEFVMNDKCAAGTGRFLDVMAHALGMKVGELADAAGQATNKVKISSMCTVFAESEVVSLVAKGVATADIVWGIHRAVAERSAILLKRLKNAQPIAMSGGVAYNRGLVASLEEKLETTLKIPEHPQIMGAFGAAALAQRSARSEPARAPAELR
jgi:(R)-2-hydroxyacyl-CoA dehydratese activating ATPase